MDTIRTLFWDILNREPDKEGLTVYTQLLGVTSKTNVINVLKESDEYKALHSEVALSHAQLTIPNLNHTYIPYKTFTIVVSRFDEDVTWVNGFNSIVYNKGGVCTSDNLQIANIGREGGTFLYHIIHNYDELAEYTVFTQGDPFPHNPDFISELHTPMHAFTALSLWWSINIPPSHVRELCSTYGIHYTNHDFVCISPVYWVDEGFLNILKRIKIRNNIKTDILEWICFRLGLEKPCSAIPVSLCGMFGVHKINIRRYSKQFYKTTYAFLIEHVDHGFIVERLWASLYLVGFREIG